MMFFSASLVTKYGTDVLEKELQKLNKLFSKYPAPTNSQSIGQSYQGVGTFGHDNDGSYEKKSLYQFMDKKENVIYFFTLYYSDKEPVTTIKYYDSADLNDFKPAKELKPLK